MKKLLLLVLGLHVMQMAMAQEHEIPADKKEKMEAAKIAFITKELELTPEEAQKFWPVYNQREAELESVRKEMRKLMKGKKIEEMTDAEVEKNMDQMMALKQKELDIEKKYKEEFKKILPVKKVAKLYVAEHKFKQEVMKEWRERHGGPCQGGQGAPPKK